MFTNRTRVAFALIAISTTACGLFVTDTGSGTSIKTLFITAVGDTLHGLNRSYQFELVALDEDGEAIAGLDVTWSTSDAAVATVDQFGVVVTKAVGETQILAAVGVSASWVRSEQRSTKPAKASPALRFRSRWRPT